MNAWSTELMADYYSSTKLSMLRYGTASGLEQSVNTTTDGVRVLGRNFYGNADTACLRSYYVDGSTTDGTADICQLSAIHSAIILILSLRPLRPALHSVVRKWPPKYQRRFRQSFSNLPNEFNHTHETRLHQVVENFYGIGDSGRMGMGVVSSIKQLLYYLMTRPTGDTV